MADNQLEKAVMELVEAARSRFYGKYRGVVTDVSDPESMGRITAKVPDIFGDSDSPWALPAAPFAGDGYGLLSLPKPGDGVWVEFEAGDPSRPIWSGFWWGTGELPEPGGPETRVWVTPKKHRIVIDDQGNLIQLVHADGAKITLDASGITLSGGGSEVTLTRDGFSVNNGALKVSNNGA